MLASAWAIMRKMLSLTGMRSNEARMSPLVVSGSIRGSLATILSLGFSFLVALVACRDQRQKERKITLYRLDHFRPRRRRRAHHIMLEADVDEPSRKQPRRLARIGRRDEACERKAAEIIRHHALLARIEMIGELCADAGHAVALCGDHFLELVLARVRPLLDEVERKLATERGGLARQLLIARLFQPARRTCGAVLGHDRFEDRGLARE